jgi:hypothetical protein
MDIVWLTPESPQFPDDQPVARRMFGVYAQTHTVAIVDEDAAAEIFGKQSVGVMIRDPYDLPVEVVGVVQAKSNDAAQKRVPTIYYGYLDHSDVPGPIRHAQFRVPVEPPMGGVELSANFVSANYFAALGLPLIAGREFSERPMPGLGGRRFTSGPGMADRPAPVSRSDHSCERVSRASGLRHLAFGDHE